MPFSSVPLGLARPASHAAHTRGLQHGTVTQGLSLTLPSSATTTTAQDQHDGHEQDHPHLHVHLNQQQYNSFVDHGPLSSSSSGLMSSPSGGLHHLFSPPPMTPIALARALPAGATYADALRAFSFSPQSMPFLFSPPPASQAHQHVFEHIFGQPAVNPPVDLPAGAELAVGLSTGAASTSSTQAYADSHPHFHTASTHTQVAMGSGHLGLGPANAHAHGPSKNTRTAHDVRASAVQLGFARAVHSGLNHLVDPSLALSSSASDVSPSLRDTHAPHALASAVSGENRGPQTPSSHFDLASILSSARTPLPAALQSPGSFPIEPT